MSTNNDLASMSNAPLNIASRIVLRNHTTIECCSKPDPNIDDYFAWEIATIPNVTGSKITPEADDIPSRYADLLSGTRTGVARREKAIGSLIRSLRSMDRARNYGPTNTRMTT